MKHLSGEMRVGCVTLDPDKMITNNLLLSRVQRYLCRPGAGVENLKIWETPKLTNQRNTQNNFTFIPRKCVRARKYVLQVSRG